jgi:hypothetical protein
VNLRVVRASARLDLQHSRRPTRYGVLMSVAGVAGAVLLHGVVAKLSALLALAGFGAIAGTALAPMNERKAGRVYWWRTLPAGSQDLMLGRLLAVTLRGIVASAGLVALFPLATSVGFDLPAFPAIAAIAVTVALVVSSAMVLITGVGLRYRVERVLAIGFLVVLFSDVLVGDRLDQATSEFAATLLADLTTGLSFAWVIGLPAIGFSLLLISILVGVTIGARAIAIAEEKTVTMSWDEPPRIRWLGLRYPAPQRFKLAALTLMHLRVAFEAVPQQLLFLIVGLVLLPFLAGDLRQFAAVYLPMMALAIPGQLPRRTSVARRTGTLEGWVTLPVRRELVSLSAVLAIAILAAIATVMIVLLRISYGTELSPARVFVLWTGLVAGTSLWNGLAAWLKPRHFVIVTVVGLFVLLTVFGIVLATTAVGGVFTSLGIMPWVQIAVGCVSLLLLAPLGGALYGRGLERFELERK